MLRIRHAAALAALFVLCSVALAFAAATPRPRSARARRPKPAARPATPRPAPPIPPAAPIDSVARAWADTVASAHGGLAAWQAVRELRFSVRLTQSAPGGATRTETSVRRLARGSRGGMYRIDTEPPKG